MASLPPEARSAILNRRQLDAFNRIGDIMVPRHGDYPSFSELGCITHIDDVIVHAPEEDMASLATLLTLVSYLPYPLLRAFVRFTQMGYRVPEPLGSLVRLLDIGLRSVIVTLYYSGKSGGGYAGKTPTDLIGYHLNIVLPGPDQARAT